MINENLKWILSNLHFVGLYGMLFGVFMQRKDLWLIGASWMILSTLTLIKIK